MPVFQAFLGIIKLFFIIICAKIILFPTTSRIKQFMILDKSQAKTMKMLNCPYPQEIKGRSRLQNTISFYKESRINLLKDFLYTNQCEIGNIIVYGHSCAIDFEYFSYLNAKYADANWTFYVVNEEQESSVLQLTKRYSIKGADIVVL